MQSKPTQAKRGGRKRGPAAVYLPRNHNRNRAHPSYQVPSFYVLTLAPELLSFPSADWCRINEAEQGMHQGLLVTS